MEKPSPQVPNGISFSKRDTHFESVSICVKVVAEAEHGNLSMITDIYTYPLICHISGPPDHPTGPIRVIRGTRNMLAIHWQPPKDNGGSPIEKYRIEKREADRSHWMFAGTCPAGG